MKLSERIEQQKHNVRKRKQINTEATEGGGFDLDRVKVITGTEDEKESQIEQLDRQIEDDGAKILKQQKMAAFNDDGDEWESGEEGTKDSPAMERKRMRGEGTKSEFGRPEENESWAEYYVRGKGKMVTGSMSIDDIKAQVSTIANPYSAQAGSTAFNRSRGFPAPQTFEGIFEQTMFGPQGLITLMPTRPVGAGQFNWMMETERDEDVDGIPEESLYPESNWKYERRSMIVRKIGTSMKLTDEQMADGPGMISEVENNLMVALRNRINRQLWSGQNTEYQVAGLKWWLDAANGSGKWDASKQESKTGAASSWGDPGAEDRAPRGFTAMLDGYIKMLTRINEAPTAIALHPVTMQQILNAFNNNFGYIAGEPTTMIGRSVWGMPFVLDAYLPQDLAIMANWPQACRIADRKEVSLMYGYSGDDFLSGRESARADARLQFYVTNTSRFQLIKNEA